VIGVLTVDDHDAFRRAASEVVEATTGFELLAEARSGDEALAVADRVVPDLVLVDVRMPGMDGFETARRLRAAHPSAVVVLISTENVATSESRSCGAAAFLPKSAFRPAALLELWAEHGGVPERGDA
jgi:DNA-binding NarL/FixJ family response regulator